MSNLAVFTTGTNLDLLRASCERVMITLHTYESNPWKGYVSGKLRDGIKFLETNPAPYVMWVDGNDSLILQPEDVILSRLHALGDPVVISGEHHCWPDQSRDIDYAKLFQRKLCSVGYLYLNAGGFIGPIQDVMTAMHVALAAATDEDDQRAWTTAYLEGLLPDVQIDHGRWMFSSVGDGKSAEVAQSCAKHWNGRVPGREGYWRQLNGN